MKITVDTNLLVRVAIDDDPAQAAIARRLLSNADVIAIPTPVLCELAWVLRRGYRLGSDEFALLVRRLIETANVVMNRQAAEQGLRQLAAGGDFADGIIAHEGRQLGGEVFLSFDRQAVEILIAAGLAAQRPGAD